MKTTIEFLPDDLLLDVATRAYALNTLAHVSLLLRSAVRRMSTGVVVKGADMSGVAHVLLRERSRGGTSLSRLTLKNVNVQYQSDWNDLKGLSFIDTLESDIIRGSSALAPIAHLTGLISLKCVLMYTVQDLTPLNHLTDLQILDCEGFYSADISSLVAQYGQFEVF